MNRSRLARVSLALCLALISLTATVSVAGASTTGSKHISKPEFAKDLAAGQVERALVNRKLRVLSVTLKDGSHVRVHYPKSQEAQTVARLQRAGVEVKVLSSAEAEKEANKKKPSHKLRYIVGAVVIVVIVLAIGALFYSRRRRRD
jgi:ATP-dependent Zn protease